MKKLIVKNCKSCIRFVREWSTHFFVHKHEGIDGLLVTVGLCIIALILCVVLKEELSKFIVAIIDTLTKNAEKILSDGLV